MHLTVAYLTNRREPMIAWFLDSLHRELGGDYSNAKLVIVDFHADEPGRKDTFSDLAHSEITHVTPMPTPWQGKHRLTKQDYFDAANARNTAVCFAPDGWIVFCDDLSVLLPGWIRGARDAVGGNYVVCGAYRKVKNLRVEHGTVLNAEPTGSDPRSPGGYDSRWNIGNDDGPTYCAGQQCYGCSFGLPVNAFLATNGQDQRASGLGFEDALFGRALENNGWKFKYDRRMLTYESEDLHGGESAFARINKKNVLGAADTAWVLKREVESGQKRFSNYFPPGGLEALRQRIMAGEPFPLPPAPSHHWVDGQPLSDL